MEKEDQLFMEEFYKNNILKNLEEENDDTKSENSYESDDNEFDFDALKNENENDLINQENQDLNKEEKKMDNCLSIIENIEWKYKKINQIEKLLDRYYITKDGLLILKNLPKFEELTDEQKFYELKKNKYKLYQNYNFDFSKYNKQNPNGLFVAGDGRLNKKKNRNKLNNQNDTNNFNRNKNLMNPLLINHNFIGMNFQNKKKRNKIFNKK